VAHTRDAALFFTDEDFVWVEPALDTAPTVPTVRPRPRRKPRTLAGDIARLRGWARTRTAALPRRALALLGAGLVAAIAALVLVVALPESPSRQSAQPPAKKTAPQPNERSANAPKRIRTLSAGDRTPAVADLQHALAALGHYSGGIDGVFGGSTSAAVTAFQTERGLTADGVAGPLTVQALVEALVERVQADAETAKQGLGTAQADGRLTPASADRYRTVLADSLARLEQLPPGRVAILALVFHDVAAIAPDYDEPRALTLFSMLERNTSHLAEHAPAADRHDITDGDGVVYRFFPGHGYQFHPIAEFAGLNKLARRGDREAAERLAHALLARGVTAGRSLVWEYYFPFGGPPSWSSGFAQAVAAQAFAQTADLVDDPELEAAARAAFRGIARGLWLEVAGGLWIREYSYTDMAILNAQLQSMVSLHDYVKRTGDEAARSALTRMDGATRAVLSQFDTGCWSRYSLGGSPASLSYHRYHVSLLKQLAEKTGDPLWSTTASRWEGYLAAGQC
jgi:D-glucuronyl C5-epimerase-like protein/putative peptidoglycan binding protein